MHTFYSVRNGILVHFPSDKEHKHPVIVNYSVSIPANCRTRDGFQAGAIGKGTRRNVLDG